HELRVLLPHQHAFGFWRHRVIVRVTIPSGGDANVSTASASVELKGAVGEARLRTASGKLDVDDVSGDLRASSASARLVVGAVGGELRFKSASGHLRATSAKGLDVDMVSGAVDVGELAGDATVTTVSGHVVIGSCVRGSVRAKAVSGSITLGIPEGVTFRVDADSATGRVRSNIPISDGPPLGGTPDVTLSAKVVSGTITIERAVRPAPAESFAG
ncbi:MAG TPA: DUF4097 family beta strand repeat-containing protein, partial [Acidimicrobiales bacterium]|nr:DUF4097 family beta strand repeat-containing protein [Acidimicrobiales bacterium]